MHRVISRSQQRNLQAQTQQFGVHLLLDGYHGSARQLADKSAIRSFLEALPTQLGMHRITDPVVVEVGPQNRKDPGGISGFVMIAESHISLHTFPLRGFISADVYTCQDSLDIGSIVQRFRDAFTLQNVDEHYIRRGLSYPARDIYESQQGVRPGYNVEGRDYGY